MIALRALRAFGIWNAGEIAGFPAERAAELIAGGFAAAVGEPPAAAAPAPEPPAKPPAFAKMKEAEIVAWARHFLGVELDAAALKKAELIAEVERLVAEKAAG